MLTSKGWKEGEGLGARAGIGMKEYLQRNEVVSSKSAPPSITGKSQSVTEIIDLTGSDNEVIEISDSQEEDEEGFETFHPPRSPTPSGPSDINDNILLPSGGISLLTPLPTVLKSDKKGIGLSTKYTILPSGVHIPNRRVTHGEKALSAHINSMEMARRHRLKWGRGSRGFKRKAKAEAIQRQQLMAYMKG
jgi:hypothetical protein